MVTNAHVVAAGNRFAVTFGNGQSHDCELVGLDKEGDIAVLKIKPGKSDQRLPLLCADAALVSILKRSFLLAGLYCRDNKTFKQLPLGSSSELIVGQSVFAIGNPFGLDQTLTVGIISGLGRELPRQEGGHSNGGLQDMIQTDAAINPGFQLCALFNVQSGLFRKSSEIS